MKSKQEKKQWSIDKTNQLREDLDNLLGCTLIDKDKMKALTDHYRISGIYQYSFLNSIMIYCQGGMLAQSFKKWKEFERNVKKGEKARIYVFTPAFWKVKDTVTGEETEKLKYFMLKPVFDVSQTEGKDLVFNHNSNDTSEYDFNDLSGKIVKITGLPVVIKPTGRSRGYCSREEIAVNEFSNNTDRIKSLFHESAHALFNHVDSKKDRGVREVEAEATAYLVMSYLNIDFELSKEYIQGWGGEADVNKLDIIKNADRIIKGITSNAEKREAA